MAADVVAERELRVRHLALSRPALELKRVLVDHAHAGGAGRVAEGLEPAVGVVAKRGTGKRQRLRIVRLRKSFRRREQAIKAGRKQSKSEILS